MPFLKRFVFSLALAILLIHPSYPSPEDYSEDHPDRNIRVAMTGRITSISVKLGDYVKKDAPIFASEAMKMEISYRARCDGYIVGSLPKVGDIVECGNPVFRVAKTMEAAPPNISIPTMAPPIPESPKTLTRNSLDPLRPIPSSDQNHEESSRANSILSEEAKTPNTSSEPSNAEVTEQPRKNPDYERENAEKIVLPHALGSLTPIDHLAPDVFELKEVHEEIHEQNKTSFTILGDDGTPPFPPNNSSKKEENFWNTRKISHMDSLKMNLNQPLQYSWVDPKSSNSQEPLAKEEQMAVLSTDFELQRQHTTSDSKHEQTLSHTEKTSFQQWANFIKSLFLFSVLYLFTINVGKTMMMSRHLNWLRIRV